MNDAEYEASKAYVVALTTFWLQTLGLGYWYIDIDHYRESLPSSSSKQFDDSAEVAAQCACDWRYQHGTISFNHLVLRDMPEEKIERIIVHEIMHVFLNETRESEGWLNHEERVASSLTSAMLWLRDETRAQPTAPAYPDYEG